MNTTTNHPDTLSVSEPASHVPGMVQGPGADGSLTPLIEYAAEGTPTGTVNGADLLATRPPAHDPVIADTFDRGAVVEIIGPSKTRKSFLTMQGALGLAAGMDTCGLGIRSPVSILIVNMELTPDDFHRRLWRMARAMGITAADIGDRLTVLNLRDAQSDAMGIIAAAVASGRYFGIIIDPIYPLLIGDESRPETWAPITGLFNRWATQYGFVLYVHHDAKGAAGDKDIRDRGAGSGVAGRNAYARLTLTPHRDDPDNSIVVNFMLRGYAPRDGITLTFKDDAFHLSDAAPTVQTARDRQARRGVVMVTPDQIVTMVSGKPMRSYAFMKALEGLGLGEKRARAMRDEMLDAGTLSAHKYGYPNATYYGTPKVIEQFRLELASKGRAE